jgi:photosystem II stability/assembly factor-like uncharacterized protein
MRLFPKGPDMPRSLIVLHTIILFVCPFSLFAQTWHSIEPRATDKNLNSICFSDNQHGWAVGNDGVIITTSDGGSLWSIQASNTADTLIDVYFSDSLNGWACGHNGALLKTENGGRDWKKQLKRTDFDLIRVRFFGKDTGWVVTSDFYIVLFRTNDGGKTWMNVSAGEVGTIRDAFFKNSDVFWLAGDHTTLLVSKDAGKSFQSIAPLEWGTMMFMDGIFFVDDSTGWALQTSTWMSLTQDGGKTWTGLEAIDSFEMPSNYIHIGGMHFFNKKNGATLLYYPPKALYRTTDAGVSWTKDSSYPETVESQQKLYFDKNNNGFTVGEFGAIYTNKQLVPIAIHSNRNLGRFGNLNDIRFLGRNLLVENSIKIKSIDLFDLFGRRIASWRSGSMSKNSYGTINITLPQLAKGNFICAITDENQVNTIRLIQKW